MARKHDAEQLLKGGLYPFRIANNMGISIGTVLQYLSLRVGEGSLRLSDVYFSWPPDKREILEQAGRGKYPDVRLLTENGLSREEFKLFSSLRSGGVFRGDMYEYVSAAEVAIHVLVRNVLEEEFGAGERGWWREGISESIRVGCASRREQDDEPSDYAYAYTTLIDLSVVISKNWKLFQSVLPTEYANSRKKLESDFRRLNRIRNAVMHPVKERNWTEADFEFVRWVSSQFETESRR